MRVKDLIDELEKMPQDLPVCIDDYMGFVEASEKTIIVERKSYVCFPFTDNDTFEYINLRGLKFDY